MIQNKELIKENRKQINKAYKIVKKYFRKIIPLNKIDIEICDSRKSFDIYWTKYYKQKSKESEVGFVVPKISHWKQCLIGKYYKKRYQIYILSKKYINKQSCFPGYFFNVLVHEIAHACFYNSAFLKNFENNIKEPLAYYIANQKKYHPLKYNEGKKIYNFIKNIKK